MASCNRNALISVNPNKVNVWKKGDRDPGMIEKAYLIPEYHAAGTWGLQTRQTVVAWLAFTQA